MTAADSPVAAGGVMAVEQATFGYRRGRAVLHEVTVEAMPGRIHAVIGPNGSGKTTLLRLMLGQARPWSGRVTLGDAAMHRLPAKRRAAAVSYVPQRASPTFSFTVRQVVTMGRYALRPDPLAVDAAMEAFALDELADAPYDELSAGQQQRVMLARAAAQAAGEGRVMLLDEPTSAMDLRHEHEAMRRLRDMAGGGLAVVIVLQDLNLVSRYADDVWLLDRGRTAAVGDWRTVLTPSVLELVYGVKLRIIEDARRDAPTPPGGDPPRPVFEVQ